MPIPLIAPATCSAVMAARLGAAAAGNAIAADRVNAEMNWYLVMM
ncbi:MAG: hypothetical protein WBQ94_11135 [Terracidiphilus sp.]